MDTSEFERLIDCCRPGTEDLADEELAALREALEQNPVLRAAWESRQAWNATIGRIMRDVSVPEGLADRIVARLEDSVTLESGAAEPPAMPVDPPARNRRVTWRRLALVAASVAAVVALVLWLDPWSRSLTAVQVAAMARGWLESLDTEGWQDSTPPVERYPLDPALRFHMVRWQTFEAWADSQAVVYLAEIPPDRAAAYLLVIRTWRGRQLPSIPPASPDSTTGGLCLGVWKNAGRLYVLAVPGSQQRYQRMLSSQSFVQRHQDARPDHQRVRQFRW